MATEQQELTEIIDLSLIADTLQIINFWLNMKQVSSDALMKELKRQDTDYLEPCLKAKKLSWLNWIPLKLC